MDTAARLEELEIRSAHQEKILSELNEVIAAQWKKIDLLEFALKRVREDMQTLALRPEGEEPPPPHY